MVALEGLGGDSLKGEEGEGAASFPNPKYPPDPVPPSEKLGKLPDKGDIEGPLALLFPFINNPEGVKIAFGLIKPEVEGEGGLEVDLSVEDGDPVRLPLPLDGFGLAVLGLSKCRLLGVPEPVDKGESRPVVISSLSSSSECEEDEEVSELRGTVIA